MIDSNCILDHVAIVVNSLDRSQKIWEDMGLTFSDEREVVESQGVETAFAQMDENAHLELLCPHGEDGPIHKFLEKKGEGIHHLCFKVPDIRAKCKELEAKGYKLLNKSPIKGAGNCLVNFLHPKSCGGVLVEISQKI